MHRTLSLALSVAAVASTARAQDVTPPPRPAPTEQDPDRDRDEDERIVVTATRTAEDPIDLPFTTATITEEDFERRLYRTVPQALRDTPGIMVQETAHGHGSPYIRGFTSFRNLFLIDGVRLNNSAFRPGPNQYWNTVDQTSIERIEVVKGPSSVLYGSDAIGGTVSVFTRSPYAWADESGFAYGGSTYLRYADAEDSVIGRGELSLGYTTESGTRTGLLIGGTIKRFGDLEGGRDTGEQPNTGYDEDDFDAKIEHWLERDVRLVFLHQRVSQDDVPRTHSTVFAKSFEGTTIGSDLRRNLDQDRRLTYLQLHAENGDGAIDTLRANVSWHEQQEVRDRIRGSGAQEFQGFDLGQFGAWVQAASDTAVGRLTYGVEYYLDDVDSFSSTNPIQGPIADDATYQMLGVYLQDEIPAGERFRFLLGGRFNWIDADADSVSDPVTGNRTSIEDSWSGFVGSARALWEAVPEELHVFGGISQGFRAPNLSDLTRFDTARSNEFEIPATGLKPEEYVQYELGTKVRTERTSAELSVFYTDIEDQILRFPTGNTNGTGDSEVTKANVGDGYAWGVEFGAAWRAIEQVEFFGNLTWLEGEVSNFESPGSQLTDTYLTRLMPLTFQIGARWEQEQGRCWAETVVIHAEDADRLSFNDVNDTQRIPPGGTPSYTLWHVRGGWNLSEHASLTAVIENVTDEDYRIHGSGLNGPGRNFVVAMTTRF